MNDIEGKAATGSSERVWVASEFQIRKLQVIAFRDLCIFYFILSNFYFFALYFFRAFRPRSIRISSFEIRISVAVL
ncbi:MAG TPA: hypothetical protein VFP99_07390, partial [Chthoniobacterales bacterium]|nr:hypothetical protein [Chthoniobacterales bacterium]